LLLQIAFPPGISGNLAIRAVGAAIDLDDQPAREACEVDDEMIDGNLLAEPAADLLQLPQLAPKAALGARSISAKVPRSFVGHGAYGYPHP